MTKRTFVTQEQYDAVHAKRLRGAQQVSESYDAYLRRIYPRGSAAWYTFREAMRDASWYREHARIAAEGFSGFEDVGGGDRSDSDGDGKHHTPGRQAPIWFGRGEHGVHG